MKLVGIPPMFAAATGSRRRRLIGTTPSSVGWRFMTPGASTLRTTRTVA